MWIESVHNTCGTEATGHRERGAFELKAGHPWRPVEVFRRSNNTGSAVLERVYERYVGVSEGVRSLWGWETGYGAPDDAGMRWDFAADRRTSRLFANRDHTQVESGLIDDKIPEGEPNHEQQVTDGKRETKGYR